MQEESEDGAVVAVLLTLKEEQTIVPRTSPAWAACFPFTPNRFDNSPVKDESPLRQTVGCAAHFGTSHQQEASSCSSPNKLTVRNDCSARVQINSFNIKISLLFQVADKSKSLK